MTVVPAVELYFLLQLGSWMGVPETVYLIIITGIVGAALAKREGFAVLQSIQSDARMGVAPTGRIMEGLMVLVGGVLLITPGVLTDLTGFLLIIPWTRKPVAAHFAKHAAVHIQNNPNIDIGGVKPGPAAREFGDHFDHPIQ